MVDDTVVVRRLVTTVLEAAPDIEVMGSAANGRLALASIERRQPDVVTLDIEMPEMDGLETLRLLRQRWPRLPVIMFSTLTERGASATLQALTLGANDYVTKPSSMGSRAEAMQAIEESLVPLVRHWGRRRSAARRPEASSASPSAPAASRPLTLRRPPAQPTPPRAVVIGVSTGGPDALTRVLPRLPASFPVPVLVVQHMPPVFTRTFAERLDARCHLRVVEAAEGDAVVSGTVYVAPGGLHLEPVRRRGGVVVGLTEAPPENSCRPAVDVMFRAAARLWGPAVLATVLTGMGKDGLVGAEAVVEAGGRVLAQDEATSVVWGMPGFVARSGLAEDVLALDDLPGALVSRCQGLSTAPAPPARAATR